MYLAGIDIGTTSICCVLVDAVTGQRIRVCNRANDASLLSNQAWERIQDPDRIMIIINTMLEELGDDWDQVEAIGISGQMHGILYVDNQGRAVSPLYNWQDQRGNLTYDEASTFMMEVQQRTNYTVATGYGFVTHFYNIHHNMVPNEAAYLCTIGDYVSMRLCGASVPLMDASNAASLGLFDIASYSFDKAALKKLGIAPEQVPALASSSRMVGATKEGVPVMCAIGDNQASFIGAVPDLEQSWLINIGTGSQISVYCAEPIQVPGMETRPFPGGGYLLVGASLSGGKSYALLEALFNDICKQFAPATAPTHSLFTQMNELAEQALRENDEELLHVSTQFYGTRADPSIAGAISGIRDIHFTAGHLIIGFLHGIVDELLSYAEAIPVRLREQIVTAAVSGNGIRKNPAMRQLVEQKLGLPLYMSPLEEEAAFGAAIYAGAASGRFLDIRDGISKFALKDEQPC